ncbi:RICIN domain-containing protein [Streptomyces sp. BE20]|nr:RICIN domain-containing protein [Streptomyces sp. BE303]MED7951135.1 RICIN domain-containing protein [Streptomyces sp. BE303]MEE1820869.1 RICIN domain-containing protein [Streptomyces sp. BE20]MEE1822200.1 RICIN domain-containing protein [Streptomyces sp. BE20]
MARHSGKCLDVINQATTNGAALEQWTCGTGTNQQFSRHTVAV